MTAEKTTLTAETVRALFNCDPETGLLTWKVSKGRARSGDIAGTLNSDGKLHVTIDCERYSLHRVIWLWHYGTWPTGLIEHKDCNQQNNRIANLLDVTRRVRSLNANTHSESGIKGVSEQCGKYRARIFHPYLQKTIHVGTFETMDEASDAYKEKHVELYGIDSPYFDEYHEPHPAIVKFAAEIIKGRSSKHE